jgi:hypothetical protein
MGARHSSLAFDLTSDQTTLWVNASAVAPVPPGTSCNNPGYSTITAAVTDASSGDRINVCPGTYTEQVVIPAGKDNIRLRSTQQWAAVIKAPPDNPLDPIKAIVRVNGAQNVTIVAFTITGPGSGGCNSLRYGVRVDMDGSADILGNHITDIRDAPPPPAVSGCQNGVAILVGRQSEMTTGSARIMGNVIENYQKNGPTVDNAGSHAEIVNNRILGVGPTATIAQNGIQVSRGATASVRQNFVSENIYSPGTATSTGILLYGAGAVQTDHNTTTSNDVGVFMAGYEFGEQICGSPAGSLTGYNRVRASSFDGIAISGSSTSNCYAVTGVQVAHNKSDQNAGPGVGVYDEHDNAVQANFVENNSGSGILLDDGHSTAVGDNQVRNNGTAGDMTDGIRVEATSMGNTLQNNHLRDNVTYDCEDNSLGTGTLNTANTWVNNHGETSSPPGLCGRDPVDADFQTSTVFGWDPNYPWYASFDLAADYDWAAAYATINTDALLQLLAQIPANGIRRPVANPDQ